MAHISFGEIAKAIMDGEVDNQLDKLDRLIRDRQRMVRQAKAAITAVSLEEGAKVRFVKSIRPTYLQGVIATVIKVNRTGAIVKIDDPIAAGRYGRLPVRCPADLLEAV